MHSYTILQWMLLFYLYCFFGWCFESVYVSILERRWVNRGFLRAPMLPIYGCGAICILIVCLPVKSSAVAVYILGIIFPTILEFITGWAMEQLFKMRYWDYSDKKGNLCGYICVESSLAWGALSLLLINVIHPPIGRFVERMPTVLVASIVIIISAEFITDFVLAFRAAFNLRKVLEEMERLHAQLEETRVQLELARAEAREKLQDLESRRTLLRRELLRRQERSNRSFSRALLRAHPTASSRRFARSLAALREQINQKRERN